MQDVPLGMSTEHLQGVQVQEKLDELMGTIPEQTHRAVCAAAKRDCEEHSEELRYEAKYIQCMFQGLSVRGGGDDTDTAEVPESPTTHTKLFRAPSKPRARSRDE